MTPSSHLYRHTSVQSDSILFCTDMQIELAAGTHKPHYSDMEKTTGEGKCGTWPTRATSGTVFKLHGTKDKKITFCGDPEYTVIDGYPNIHTGAGIQIVRSTHVRFAGFRVQNMLRAVDLQDTFWSEVLFITSSHTWHEGVRIRYNSSHNLLAHSHIQHTGKGYVGNGEGVYIGTAYGRTVACGEAQDQSDFNIIRNNTFGPHVPSENIDVKEFTTGGQIIENRFNGSDLKGIHASISWIALKGRQYTVKDNIGQGLGVKGSGIRVLKRAPKYGSDNVIRHNICHNLSDGSYCVFIDRRTVNNTIACNILTSDEDTRAEALMSNKKQTRC